MNADFHHPPDEEPLSSSSFAPSRLRAAAFNKESIGGQKNRRLAMGRFWVSHEGTGARRHEDKDIQHFSSRAFGMGRLLFSREGAKAQRREEKAGELEVNGSRAAKTGTGSARIILSHPTMIPQSAST